MTTLTSRRYDFGLCGIGYVTESDFYENVTLRFRQADGLDEAQVTLTEDDARELLERIAGVLGADPSRLIFAQLNGQKMAAAADTRC